MFSRLLFVLSFATAASAFAADSKYLIFVGTYTGKGSLGIYSYRFDPATGSATPWVSPPNRLTPHSSQPIHKDVSLRCQ